MTVVGTVPIFSIDEGVEPADETINVFELNRERSERLIFHDVAFAEVRAA